MKMNNQTATIETETDAPKQFFVTSTAGTRNKMITAKDKRSARNIYSNLTGCGFKNCKVSAQ